MKKIFFLVILALFFSMDLLAQKVKIGDFAQVELPKNAVILTSSNYKDVLKGKSIDISTNLSKNSFTTFYLNEVVYNIKTFKSKNKINIKKEVENENRYRLSADDIFELVNIKGSDFMITHSKWSDKIFVKGVDASGYNVFWGTIEFASEDRDKAYSDVKYFLQGVSFNK